MLDFIATLKDGPQFQLQQSSAHSEDGSIFPIGNPDISILNAVGLIHCNLSKPFTVTGLQYIQTPIFPFCGEKSGIGSYFTTIVLRNYLEAI